MIINSFQLSGNEHTLAELTSLVNSGSYDFHIGDTGCIMLTSDCGLVLIKPDKSIVTNIAISFDDKVNDARLNQIEQTVGEKANSATVNESLAEIDTRLNHLDSAYRFINTVMSTEGDDTVNSGSTDLDLTEAIIYGDCAMLTEDSASLKVTVMFKIGTPKSVIIPGILNQQSNHFRYRLSVAGGVFDGRLAIQHGADTDIVDEKLCNAALSVGSCGLIKSIEFSIVSDNSVNIPVGTTFTIYGR